MGSGSVKSPLDIFKEKKFSGPVMSKHLFLKRDSGGPNFGRRPDGLAEVQDGLVQKSDH